MTRLFDLKEEKHDSLADLGSFHRKQAATVASIVSEMREDLSQSRQRLAPAEDNLATAGSLCAKASTVATTEH